MKTVFQGRPRLDEHHHTENQNVQDEFFVYLLGVISNLRDSVSQVTLILGGLLIVNMEIK